MEEDDKAFEEADSEETAEEDKTSEEKNEEGKDGKEQKKDEKTNRSDIVQKRKYRERAIKAEQSVSELKAELQSLKEMIKKPSDEAEAKAQEYIRGEARRVYEELKTAEEKKKNDELASFESQVQSILEDNPDIAEEELLETVEEYDVEPETAVKILKKNVSKKEKPKMPKPARAGGSEGKDTKRDDSKKSLWQIAREEAKKFTENQ